jgi:short-subunit dehydrogenase
MGFMSPTEIPTNTPLTSQKRAIIVGASTGLGAALARELAKNGFLLALLARNEAQLQELCRSINEQAGSQIAFTYPHDVTDFEAVPTLFQQILADLRQIDVVVYNAGVMPSAGFSEYPFEKDREMISVNLLGGMAWLGQAAQFFERKGSGQIVGISSVAGDRGRVKNPGYAASKAGLDTYLESLRNRLTRSGVRILTVRPGPLKTRMTEEVGGLFMISPEKAARDISRAIRRRKQVLYTPARWRLIMLIVRNIPSIIFRRMKF